MFVGREDELKVLGDVYASGSFGMVVLYGRRRVGKTALLEQFARDKPALFFTAQIQADADNLRDFSRAVNEFFEMPPSTPAFGTWLDALEFVAERSRGMHLLFVFDELPYAAKANSSLPSALQIAVDRSFSHGDCLMILCGSNQGFMEEEVLSEKSPLYGRRTAQLKLRPFDYLDAAKMLPDCSPAERLSYYASLGGTPYYLSGVNHRLGYVENMATLFFARAGVMFDEPNMLLRQELREPAMYGSVLRAIAGGANKSSEIADRAGLAHTSVTTYLKTLETLDLVERCVPFGEPQKSKRSLYRIKDPAFLFWYRFVAPYVPSVEAGLGEGVAKRLLAGEARSEYEGHLFERVCREWALREARGGRLPVQVTAVSSWWGTDPVAREQTDIDLVAADDIDKQVILGECKWRESLNETEAINTLKGRQHLIPGYRDYWFYLFTKHAASSGTREKALEDGRVALVSIDEMYG